MSWGSSIGLTGTKPEAKRRGVGAAATILLGELCEGRQVASSDDLDNLRSSPAVTHQGRGGREIRLVLRVSDVLNTHEAGQARKQLPLEVADPAAVRRYELTTVCRAGS